MNSYSTIPASYRPPQRKFSDVASSPMDVDERPADVDEAHDSSVRPHALSVDTRSDAGLHPYDSISNKSATPPLSAGSSLSSQSSVCSGIMTKFHVGFEEFVQQQHRQQERAKRSHAATTDYGAACMTSSPAGFASADEQAQKRQATAGWRQSILADEPLGRHHREAPWGAVPAAAAGHEAGVTTDGELPAAPDLDQQRVEPPPVETHLSWEDQERLDRLIQVSIVAIESIWPKATTDCKPAGAVSGCEQAEASKVLPLHFFIKETLRRSRSTCAVLQTALYYLHRVRTPIRQKVVDSEEAKARFQAMVALRSAVPHTADWQFEGEPPVDSHEFTLAASRVLRTSSNPVICGRRMFLASLIVASKFLQDRTYSNKAWSRLSGLSVPEINLNERALLDLLGYRLFVKAELFDNWSMRLQKLEDRCVVDRTPIVRSASAYAVPEATMEIKATTPATCYNEPASVSLHRSSSDVGGIAKFQRPALAKSFSAADTQRFGRPVAGLPLSNLNPAANLGQQSARTQHPTARVASNLQHVLRSSCQPCRPLTRSRTATCQAAY